ncbi:MAG: DNA topoisomerase 3 [Bacteroidales bacterium]|nr:DNA topoisomerase 3 [Bacteroidales bacterium]
MKVCIAEKPSVAQTIANVLGATSKHQGYFEGNGFQVTWTYGHLCTLKAPDEYTPQWKRWDMNYLPMVPPRFGISLIDDEGIKRQFKIIEGLYANAECVINCGDAGQEGELIQRWVMQKANVKCPVYRLWISSLTDEAVAEGFRNLMPQDKYQNLYMAGLSRSIGDWLLGMNATRLYTIRYGQKDQRQVISIGRVQTPTLALIVKRHWEIVNFEPQQYWELKTLYRNVTFNSTKGRFDKKEDAEKLLEKIQDTEFTITDIQKKQGKEIPPRLYDLTSLQVDCNRKFGFSADETLKLIQSLYEKKVTTYPRVDTTFLSDDIYPKCPGILGGLRGYESFTTELFGKKLPKSKKVFDNSKVTDHHAIIPTGVPAINLNEWESKVYDLVARRFIAVFYPDCIFSSTTVLGEAAEVPFKATGKIILDPGWRKLYANEPARDVVEKNKANEEEQDENILPDFMKGESGPHRPSLLEKWTQPPKLYTEATLLRAMETAGKLCDDEDLRDAMKENGLGRPSTRAAIIETLFKRRYIRKEKKNLVATQTGIEVIKTIKQEILKSAELTGQWEKKLRMIERGEYEPGVFYQELKTMVAQIAAEVKSDLTSPRIAYVSEEEVQNTRKRGKSQQNS